MCFPDLNQTSRNRRPCCDDSKSCESSAGGDKYSHGFRIYLCTATVTQFCTGLHLREGVSVFYVMWRDDAASSDKSRVRIGGCFWILKPLHQQLTVHLNERTQQTPSIHSSILPSFLPSILPAEDVRMLKQDPGTVTTPTALQIKNTLNYVLRASDNVTVSFPNVTQFRPPLLRKPRRSEVGNKRLFFTHFPLCASELEHVSLASPRVLTH